MTNTNHDMELLPFFRGVLEEDRCAVVLCRLDHTILYMNPAAAERYAKRGGAALLGTNLLSCHGSTAARRIEEVVRWFAGDPSHNRVHTFYNAKENKDVYMAALRDADGQLIGYYEKHEYRDRETAAPYDFSAPAGQGHAPQENRKDSEKGYA